MQNLVFTQTSDTEIRQIFREEIQSFFQTYNFPDKPNQNDIGGIDLACEVTRLAKPTIYGLVSTRGIPHSKQGKKLYFSRRELLEWLVSGKRKTHAEIISEAAGAKK